MSAATSRDYSATERVVQFLEKSKSENDLILDYFPGIFAILDQHGEVLKGNQNLADLAGVPFEELHLENLVNIVSREDRESLKIALSATIGSQKPQKSIEVSIDSGVGSRKFLVTCSSKKIEKNIKVPTIEVIGTEITELLSLTHANAEMSYDLKAAEIVQTAVLPVPKGKLGNCSVHGFYQSASRCGGDWWHYIKIGDYAVLALADVTGHGVAAALVTSSLAATATLMAEQGCHDLDIWAKYMNKVVLELCKGEKLVTAVFAKVHLESGEYSINSLGHPSVIVSSEVGQVVTYVDTEASTVLGLGETLNISRVDGKMNQNDKIFLYSDGVLDILNQEGRSYDNRFFRSIKRRLFIEDVQQQDLIGKLHKDMEKFRGDAELIDDVSFFFLNFSL